MEVLLGRRLERGIYIEQVQQPDERAEQGSVEGDENAGRQAENRVEQLVPREHARA
jgi:hypothetical protein